MSHEYGSGLVEHIPEAAPALKAAELSTRQLMLS